MPADVIPPRRPIANLSCFIIAKNEADRIGRTIEAVRGLVSEVVVVDSGSRDGTQEIASRLGARVIHNDWPGFGQQKRFAESQCRNDWLLNLDADEVLTPDLATSIADAFASGQPPHAGYWVDDHVVYPGWTRPRRFARDHRFIRLYDRSRMRFRDSTLFDTVDAGSHAIGSLKGALHHHAVRSFDDLIAKCDERASYNAGHAKAKPAWHLAARAAIEFPTQFFKYYLWRTHIFGGLAGFQFALIVAFYRFIRIVRMREGAKAIDLNTTRPGARVAVSPPPSPPEAGL
jgi:glycosyltransferase involved in cell wall biosynthesis